MGDLSRRDALKTLGAAASALGLAAVPEVWSKSVVEAASLPEVAAASPAPTATDAPAPTATATPAAGSTQLAVAINPVTTPGNPSYLALSGTATPGSTVTLTVTPSPTVFGTGSVYTGSTTSDASGRWSILVPRGISVGIGLGPGSATAVASKPGAASASATIQYVGLIPG